MSRKQDKKQAKKDKEQREWEKRDRREMALAQCIVAVINSGVLQK